MDAEAFTKDETVIRQDWTSVDLGHDPQLSHESATEGSGEDDALLAPPPPPPQQRQLLHLTVSECPECAAKRQTSENCHMAVVMRDAQKRQKRVCDQRSTPHNDGNPTCQAIALMIWWFACAYMVYAFVELLVDRP